MSQTLHHYATLAFESYLSSAMPLYKSLDYEAHQITDAPDRAFLLIKDKKMTIVISGSDDPVDWVKNIMGGLYERDADVLMMQVKLAIALIKPKQITIVGHSRGGAIGLWLASKVPRDYPVRLITFGMPRALRKGTMLRPIEHTRVVVADDPGPYLPPSAGLATHHGTPHIIGVGNGSSAWKRLKTGRFLTLAKLPGDYLEGHMGYVKALENCDV